MSKFSERIGAVQATSVLQLDSISEPLRNSVWNFLHSIYCEGESGWWEPAEVLSQWFFKVPVDDLPTYNLRRRDWIRARFYELEWHQAYDFIEFMADYQGRRRHTEFTKDAMYRVFNKIFETEHSGYRFLGGELSPISSAAEVEAIDAAVKLAGTSGLAGAHTHLKSALHLLGKRPVPDYRNAVKEAISAVESVAKRLSQNESQGLASALDELAKQVPIHGALKSAFVKLYGYTSDTDGVRHAILDEPSVGFDEAKYMVVACSAFVSYLATKANAAKLPLGQ
jgi:AbiJ N-terminal domain 4